MWGVRRQWTAHHFKMAEVEPAVSMSVHRVESPTSEYEPGKTVVNAHIVNLRLLFTGWITHFRSPGYMKDDTMQLLDKTICKRSVDLTVKDANFRYVDGRFSKCTESLSTTSNLC